MYGGIDRRQRHKTTTLCLKTHGDRSAPQVVNKFQILFRDRVSGICFAIIGTLLFQIRLTLQLCRSIIRLHLSAGDIDAARFLGKDCQSALADHRCREKKRQ